MSKNRKICFTLGFFAFLSIVGVAFQVMGETGATDVQHLPGTFYKADTRYSFGTHTETKSAYDGFNGNITQWESCLPGWVVRGFYLKEKDHADFRRAYFFCREMEEAGTLLNDNERNDFFRLQGNGETGSTLVPLDKLPVGLEIQIRSNLNVSDVALLYNSANNVINHNSSYQWADYALGRSDTTRTLMCPDGYVVTGIGVRAEHGEDLFGTDSDINEIHEIGIKCTELSRK